MKEYDHGCISFPVKACYMWKSNCITERRHENMITVVLVFRWWCMFESACKIGWYLDNIKMVVLYLTSLVTSNFMAEVKQEMVKIRFGNSQFAILKITHSKIKIEWFTQTMPNYGIDGRRELQAANLDTHSFPLLQLLSHCWEGI